ncbi:MAG: phosphoesterase [Thermoguttaceae bacterium]
MSTSSENVLVVPTSLFHTLGYFEGFSRDADRYIPTLLSPANWEFRPRSEVEGDPSWKQLIPYMLLCYTPQSAMSIAPPISGCFCDTSQVFCYVRGKGMGEGRLHSKRSVGIGGHISSVDGTSGDVYRDGMRRELEEEVEITSSYREQCVGLINDDSTEVGRVHLGIVHRFDLASPHVTPREPDLIECNFVAASELMTDLERFESWSAIALAALYRKR